MLLELINSIFVTFVATECLLVNSNDNTSISIDSNQHRQPLLRLFLRYTRRFSRTLQVLTLIVALINLFVHFHDSGVALSKWIKANVEIFHIPRIVAAIVTFLIALWWDCRRIVIASAAKKSRDTDNGNNTPSSVWSNNYFLGQLVKSFCRTLPIYPFAAVIISFMCLFVITLFEDLHIDTEILNGPIYYCTLYGPLMMIYWDVKGKFAKTVINGEIILPR